MSNVQLPQVKVLNAKLGYVKLPDGTLLVLRVAVVDVRVAHMESPFGVEFEVSFTTGVAAYPSEKALEEFRDKRILAPGEKPPSSWCQLEITSRDPAVEEVEYTDSKLGRYSIRVEIEPIMVSVNTEVRNVRGEPYYVVRWIPKITWKKVGELKN